MCWKFTSLQNNLILDRVKEDLNWFEFTFWNSTYFCLIIFQCNSVKATGMKTQFVLFFVFQNTIWFVSEICLIHKRFLFTNHFDEQEELVHTSRSQMIQGLNKTLIKSSSFFAITQSTCKFLYSSQSEAPRTCQQYITSKRNITQCSIRLYFEEFW